jgi:hypothetical protein
MADSVKKQGRRINHYQPPHSRSAAPPAKAQENEFHRNKGGWLLFVYSILQFKGVWLSCLRFTLLLVKYELCSLLSRAGASAADAQQTCFSFNPSKCHNVEEGAALVAPTKSIVKRNNASTASANTRSKVKEHRKDAPIFVKRDVASRGCQNREPGRPGSTRTSTKCSYTQPGGCCPLI